MTLTKVTIVCNNRQMKHSEFEMCLHLLLSLMNVIFLLGLQLIPCASSSEHTTRGRKIISFSVCG